MSKIVGFYVLDSLNKYMQKHEVMPNNDVIQLVANRKSSAGIGSRSAVAGSILLFN